jgi:fused signal recognition particle receptor
MDNMITSRPYGNPLPASILALILSMTLPLAVTGGLHAQDQQSDTQSTDQEESSEQVERRDQQYRRQMELEDALERSDDMLDQGTYADQANMSKLAKLPRSSQEHLKEEMKEIIIEGDQWKPEDAGKKFPFVPSAAAEMDSDLAQREEEAWNEMVENYHQREAAAHAAQQAANSGASSQGGQQGGQQGQENGQAGGGGSQGADSASGSAGGSYNPNASQRTSEDEGPSTAGVSQSALDFLKNRSNGSGGAGKVLAENEIGAGGGNSRTPGDPGDQEGNNGPVPQADQGSSPEPPAGAAESMAGGSAQEPPDGSLPISELEKLQGLSQQQAARSGPAGSPDQSAPTTTPEQSPGESQADSLASNSSAPELQQEQQEQQASEQESAEPATAEEIAQEQAEDAAEEMAQDAAEETAEAEQLAENEQQTESPDQTSPEQVELNLETPGIIAIRDLDKLEGVDAPPETEERPPEN